MPNYEQMDAAKKKIGKTFMNNIGLFMSVILTFAVIVIMTTDIHLVSFQEITALGIDFFLLLFCSYSMYVCLADTGSKAGLSTEKYTKSVDEYASEKKKIFQGNMQNRMLDFCNYYVTNELQNTRTSIIAVVGLSYDDYLEKYMHLDDKGIEALTDLNSAQKKAIRKANKIKPIKLTPEMILRQGRSAKRRSALEINPVTKKNVKFGFKFVQRISSYGHSCHPQASGCRKIPARWRSWRIAGADADPPHQSCNIPSFWHRTPADGQTRTPPSGW